MRAALTARPASMVWSTTVLMWPLAAVEDFRRRRPRTAEQIAEALEVWEAQLRRRLDRAEAGA